MFRGLVIIPGIIANVLHPALVFPSIDSMLSFLMDRASVAQWNVVSSLGAAMGAANFQGLISPFKCQLIAAL
jgi:hypothetical protein